MKVNSLSEIEGIILKSLEENKPELILEGNEEWDLLSSSSKDSLFGDKDIDELVKKFMKTGNKVIFEKLRNIFNKSQGKFAEEESTEGELSQRLRNTNGNIREIQDTINFLKTQPMDADYWSNVKKELSDNFGNEFASSLIDIVFGKKFLENSPIIEETLKQTKQGGFSVITPFENLLSHAFDSEEEFSKAYAEFSEQLCGFSIDEILDEVPSYFSNLDVEELLKQSIDKTNATEVQKMLTGESWEVSDISDVSNDDIIRLKTKEGIIRVKDAIGEGDDIAQFSAILYDSIPALFAEQGSEIKIDKSQLIGSQNIMNESKKDKTLREGTKFKINEESTKDKTFTILSVISDNKFKVSDGVDEYELELENSDMDKIEVL